MSKMSIYIVILLVLGAMGFAAYVRLAPSDLAQWHVDPVAADDPGPGGIRYVPTAEGGPVPVYEVPPEELIVAFDAFAMAQPRVTRLAGSTAEGRITYIARTKWWGFPDYITVESLALGPDRSTLAILSRLRFGGSDLGVNRARIDAWLQAFDPLR